MDRIDQCSMCGSLNATALNADGTRYDPFAEGYRLWAKFRCDECGHVWPFTFVVFANRPSLATDEVQEDR